MDEKKRLIGIQGLRGIGIVMIIVSHCGTDINTAMHYLGLLGVEIFFVLSGYLTMYHSVNSSFGSLKCHLVRIVKKMTRVGGLYPLHVVTLLAAIPLSYKIFLLGDKLKYIVKLLIQLLLCQSWIPSLDVYMGFNGTAWYLSVYVFLACISNVIVKVIRGWSLKKCASMIGVIVAIQYIAAFVFVRGTDPKVIWLLYVCPLSRALDFVLGCCICRIHKERKLTKHYNAQLVAGMILAICALMFMNGKELSIGLTALWSIPSILIVSGTIMGEKDSVFIKSVFQNKVAIWIGNISMELFLIHQLVIKYFQYWYDTRNRICPGYMFILAVLIGVLLSVLWNRVHQIVRKKQSNMSVE